MQDVKPRNILFLCVLRSQGAAQFKMETTVLKHSAWLYENMWFLHCFCHESTRLQVSFQDQGIVEISARLRSRGAL